VARTSGTDIQLHSHRHGWIWNFKFEPNQWYVMRYNITAPLRTAFANGLTVYTEKPQTNRFLGTGPVTIFGANNEVIEVKKFLVEPLN
jgi:hypothetical protein